MRHSGNRESSPSSFSREPITQAISAIELALAPLNDDVSYAKSPSSYDSLIVFSSTDDDPIATPIATLDGLGSNRCQRRFRDTLMDYRIRKPGTALAEGTHQFVQSTLNPDPQMTFSLPLIDKDAQIGVVQYSFSEHFNDEGINLPDSDVLEKIWEHHAKSVADVTASLAGLHRLAKERHRTIPRLLLKKLPVAPNSFLIRWDIEGATALSRSEQQPLLDDFIDEAQLELTKLVQEYTDHPEKTHWNLSEVYSDQGDGAYIALKIPDTFNTYPRQFTDDFRRHVGQKFIAEVEKRLNAIADASPDGFRPTIHTNGDFAHVELNSLGRLSAQAMYELADRQKEK